MRYLILLVVVLCLVACGSVGVVVRTAMPTATPAIGTTVVTPIPPTATPTPLPVTATPGLPAVVVYVDGRQVTVQDWEFERRYTRCWEQEYLTMCEEKARAWADRDLVLLQDMGAGYQPEVISIAGDSLERLQFAYGEPGSAWPQSATRMTVVTQADGRFTFLNHGFVSDDPVDWHQMLVLVGTTWQDGVPVAVSVVLLTEDWLSPEEWVREVVFGGAPLGAPTSTPTPTSVHGLAMGRIVCQGRPVPGRTVYLLQIGWQGFWSATTDRGGRWSGGLPPGRYGLYTGVEPPSGLPTFPPERVREITPGGIADWGDTEQCDLTPTPTP